MRWFVYILVGCVIIIGCLLATFWFQGYQGKATDYFDGKRFYNITGHKHITWKDIFVWRLTRKDPNWPKQVTYPSYPLPNKLIETDQVSVTFINHATFLLQGEGINMLTDPIWSDYASPFQWIGPKRVYKPGLSLASLPHIDAVLLSHNHYDHLDIQTCLKLQQLNPNIIFITGLGVDHNLRPYGIKHIVTLKWWQQYHIKTLGITFVPAQHFSGRGINDRNKTLWGGFMIHYAKHPVYFAGDTAAGSHFEQIKQRLGSISLAILPIGAYAPRHIMRSSHIHPEEAVEAMQQLAANYAIGMHFDTFSNLTDEPFGEASQRLYHALQKQHIDKQRFKVLHPGQSCLYKDTLVCNQPIRQSGNHVPSS